MDWGTPRRWVQANAVEEGGLGGVRAHDAAQQRVAAILRGERDVSALDPAQFLQDGPGTPAEPGPLLPLLQGLPD